MQWSHNYKKKRITTRQYCPCTEPETLKLPLGIIFFPSRFFQRISGKFVMSDTWFLLRA
jgi:hypothetical protein